MNINRNMKMTKVVDDPIPDNKDILVRDPEKIKEIVDDTVEAVSDIGTGIFSEISYAIGRWFW